jgi:hypothetical protein
MPVDRRLIVAVVSLFIRCNGVKLGYPDNRTVKMVRPAAYKTHQR